MLVNHGSVEHGHGSVRRTIVFTHTGIGGDRRMLLNLSDTYLSLFDIEDVDHPIAQAEVELAPDVEALYRYGNFLVEHVRDEGYDYGYDTASIFRVKATGGTIDETQPVASFTVGQVQRVMKWKNALVIFRRKANPSGGANNPYYGGETSQVVVYDMTDPTHPSFKSSTDLGYSIYPYYPFWCGDFGFYGGWWGGWWWNYGSSSISFDGGLAFQMTSYDYTSNNSVNHLLYLNLADLSAPVVKEHTLDGNNRDVLALTADSTDPGGFFLTYRDRIGVTNPFPNVTLAQYKYYAQRWSGSGDDISADAATNVPGQIVRSWKSGDRTLLLTQDSVYTWVADPNNVGQGYYNGSPRLHLLERRDDSTAAWRAAHFFDGRYLGSLVGDADRIYLTSSKAYVYSYLDATVSNGTTKAEDSADHLTIIDAGQLTLDPSFDASIGLANISAMGANAGRLYLSVPSSGVLVMNATDGANPVGRSFLRTLGWGTHLEVAGDTIYVAAGNFGVFQRTLGALTLAP